VVGEIESTKSVGELYAPVDGEVVEANQAVVDDPSLVNSDPFGDGWMIAVRFAALPTLLSADEYAALTAE
jgi:glycine cleavage system H protein